MLKVDRTNMSVDVVSSTSLADAGLRENQFRDMLLKNGAEIFREMNESLLILGKEVCPSDTVADRIDILAIDPQGNAVVIELKRYENKLQLLQGITYAAMLSDWEEQDFVRELSKYMRVDDAEASQMLRDKLDTHDGEGIDINEAQRVILIAEQFDYSLLKATEWLFNKYRVDVKCYRFSCFRDGESDYVSFDLVFPPRELAEHASKRNRRRFLGAAEDSDTCSITRGEESSSSSESVRNFFANLPDGAEVTSRGIACRVGGTRRFHLAPRQREAYCWQDGRFDDDVAHWRRELSAPTRVEEVNAMRSLRFYLVTEQDFEAFRRFLKETAAGIEFQD